MPERLIYLSGPITGVTHDGASTWREYAHNQLARLSNGIIKTISPMRGKRYLDDGKPIERFNDRKGQLSSQQMIYTRDRNDTKRSHVMLINLLGATERVSIGSVIEIGWADAFGVPIVCAVEKENIHRHPILDEAVCVITDNLDAAIKLTYELVRDDTF